MLQYLFCVMMTKRRLKNCYEKLIRVTMTKKLLQGGIMIDTSHDDQKSLKRFYDY